MNGAPDFVLDEDAIIGERLTPSVMDPRIEFHETWLYFHLVQAGNARGAIDRAHSWGDYDEALTKRRNSIASASTHYRALLRFGLQIDTLLASMALTEGLTP
jgi:hypothetical protein